MRRQQLESQLEDIFDGEDDDSYCQHYWDARNHAAFGGV
jgi:hypothetical protein